MVPSLEIRINSVNDARAVVADLENLNRKAKELEAESIELKIAEECVRDVQSQLFGVFRLKVYTNVVKTGEGKALFVPAPYCQACAFSPAGKPF